MEIITEINHQNQIVGFTSNYIKVLVDNPVELKQNLDIFVKLCSRESDFIHATYIKKGE